MDRYVGRSRGKSRICSDEKRRDIGVAELAELAVEFPSLRVIPAGHPRRAARSRDLCSCDSPRFFAGVRIGRRRRGRREGWKRRQVAHVAPWRTSPHSRNRSSGRDPAATAARRTAVSRGSRGNGPACEARIAATSRIAATKKSVSFRHSRRNAASSALNDDWRNAISFSTSSCIAYVWGNGEEETVVHRRGSSGRKRKPRRMSASAASTPRMSQICLLLRGRERATIHRVQTTRSLGGRQNYSSALCGEPTVAAAHEGDVVLLDAAELLHRLLLAGHVHEPVLLQHRRDDLP